MLKNIWNVLLLLTLEANETMFWVRSIPRNKEVSAEQKRLWETTEDIAFEQDSLRTDFRSESLSELVCHWESENI